MAASAHAFRIGRIHLYQMLLSKPDCDQCHLPLMQKHDGTGNSDHAVFSSL
jgi:hypothetical protein